MPPRKPKNPPAETFTPIVVPSEPDTRTPLMLEVAYRWHRGEEAIAVQVWRDAHPEEERPSIAEAQERCAEIAKVGPPPADYQPPGAEPAPESVLEGIVHPADPAYQPTDHAEPLPEVTTPTPSRYRVLGEKELDHEFRLSLEEGHAFSQRAEKARRDVVDLENQHAAIRKQMKADLSAAEKEQARLSTCAAELKEVRSVKVRMVADYVVGTVSYVLIDGPDAGTTIRTAPLSDDDRQLSLFREHTRANGVVSGILAELNEPPAEGQDGDKGDQDDGDEDLLDGFGSAPRGEDPDGF